MRKKRLGKDDILKTTQLEENFVTKKYYQHTSKKKKHLRKKRLERTPLCSVSL